MHTLRLFLQMSSSTWTLFEKQEIIHPAAINLHTPYESNFTVLLSNFYQKKKERLHLSPLNTHIDLFFEPLTEIAWSYQNESFQLLPKLVLEQCRNAVFVAKKKETFWMRKCRRRRLSPDSDYKISYRCLCNEPAWSIKCCNASCSP